MSPLFSNKYEVIRMGGSIGLTIREPNGKEHRMCEWTNNIPSNINNLNIIKKDPAYLNEITKDWYSMRKDYEKHKVDKKFENNISPIYATHPFLAPIEYGLILIDMAENQILDCQGYSRLGGMYSPEIGLDVLENEDRNSRKRASKQRYADRVFSSGDEYSANMRFLKFYQARRVKESIDIMTRQTTLLENVSLDEIAKMIMSNTNYFFPIDFSPFQITKYEENDAEDAKKMLTKIEQLGFKLTDKEKHIWDEWIQESN